MEENNTSQQVAEAAMAMVRPHTAAATRTAASQFLETWTRTPQAWNVYAAWIQSFSTSSNNNNDDDSSSAESVGMQLLCLQLLQAKIRREVSRGTAASANKHPALLAIQSELACYLQQRSRQQLQTQQQPQQNAASVLTSACICMASLTVRCGTLPDLIQSCRSACCSTESPLVREQPQISPDIALRLLTNIPLEVEACSDLTTSAVTAELWPYIETVLDTLRQSLEVESVLDTLRQALAVPTVDCLALEALKNWIKTCHISLTLLHSPTCGGSASILPVLVHLLSIRQRQQPTTERFLVKASQALTEATLIPSDACTDTRTAACQCMFQAISGGFVAVPLQQATECGWDDASHALATLLCTLVTEEVDDLVSQPAEPVLHLLLQIQNHPSSTAVRCTALECWLTVQEIATRQRHDNWKAPLFRQVVEGLLVGMAYPPTFVNWATELDVDESEFTQFRRMVKDVLISAYFLLRVEFVRRTAHLAVAGHDWTVQEAALVGLTVTAREVCARVKTQTRSLVQDRDQTAQTLLELLQQLQCGAADSAAAVQFAASRHPLVLTAVTELVGAYAPAWASKCSPEAVLQLLVYLRAVLARNTTTTTTSTDGGGGGGGPVLQASKSIRSILVNCSPLLLSCSDPATQQSLLDRVRQVMEAVLATDQEDAMVTVAEGSTRLLVQIKDPNILRQSLGSLTGPVLHRGDAALHAIPTDGSALSEQAFDAVESLGRHLHVLQVIVRFCDTPAGETGTTVVISDMMASIWSFLERVSQGAVQHEYILDKVMAIHEQLLKNVPEMIAPHFDATVQFVVGVFERTKHPSTLAYVAGAVEVFGSGSVESFQNLLSHVAAVMFQYISTNKRVEECPELIKAFFECTQRYILFCPAALVHCPQFPSIVSCATECLTACQGERESTRATLNFLGQLIGWRALPLSANLQQALQGSSHIVDEQVAQHGARITQSCLATLLGGPQMLWPACTECLFAVIAATVSWPVPEDPESCVAKQWMGMAQHTAIQQPASPTSSTSSTCAEQHGGTNSTNHNNHQHQHHHHLVDVYQQVVMILLGLAREGPKSKSKAKMLLTDYCKIHKGEMSADALITYRLG